MIGAISGIGRDARMQAILLLLIFTAAYQVPLKGMIHAWTTNQDYSYGYIIPVISAYLLWEKRDYLKELRIKSSWWIFPFLAAAVLLSIYGILGSSGNIAMPAVPLLILLFTAFVFGVEAVNKLKLPLGFLIFMVPVPAALERTLGIYLKSVSSKLGGAFISLCNIPVHVSGNVIDLGVSKLQVVDACSGMRFLFPLLALGVLYAYFLEKVLWKQIFCVLATLPIAVLNNGMRIGITGVLTTYYGPEAAEGFFHDFEGWVMFMVAFFFLYLLGRILRFFPPRPGVEQPSPPGPSPVASAHGQMNRVSPGAFYTALGLLVVVGVLTFSTSALPAVKLRGGIAGFPLAFSGWQGEAEFVDPRIVAESGAEESFSGRYSDGTNSLVSLYMGYRSTAFLENENFFHSPTVCLPSSGWETVWKKVRTIENVPHFGTLRVTEMMIEGMGARQLVYFWFQTKDRSTPDKNVNRFHLTLHALQRDNTHDLFIRPITRLAPNEKVEDAQKRMDGFVREMMGAMNTYLAVNLQ